MGEEMQTGFSAAGGAPAETGTPQTESASSTETSTTDSSATGNEGGLPPTATQPVADKNLVATSEKGSFELRYNERTGRNEVVSTMPQETEGPETDSSPQPQSNTYSNNELMEALNNPQPPQPQQPAPEYTLQELQAAMQAGAIDEARIPVAMRPGYYAALAQQQPQQAPPPQQEQGQEQAPQQSETEQAQAFYGKVQNLANERAMKEIGITQDELDVAEYTDDQAILDKYNAYRVAVENNRAQILREVSDIRRQQQAVIEDRGRAYSAIETFVNEMKKKEPNFKAIDTLMITRTEKMPYEEAIKVRPLIEKVKNGTLSTADLPALQEMYNQTRLEFYSGKTGVSLAPKVTKPAYVETPGSGGDVPRKTTPLSALGKMSKRDREAAIGQMFGNFFDE